MSGRIHTTAGVDVGSAAVKVAIARSHAGVDGEVLATRGQRIRRRNVFEVVRSCFQEAWAAAGSPDLDYTASTGDGDAVPFRTGHFYSMTTHGRGGMHLVPSAGGVVDVGALHARAMRIDERGKVVAHRMTSQCASGSGQFLENIARYLGVPLEDVGELSLASIEPEGVSSICAVLAETDVINMVSRGISTSNILKGIHLSIAGRLSRLIRSTKVEGTVVVTGGLAHDVGLLGALGEQLAATKSRRGPTAKVEVLTHPDAMMAGAIGAALLGGYRYEQLERAGRLELTRVGGVPLPA